MPSLITKEERDIDAVDYLQKIIIEVTGIFIFLVVIVSSVTSMTAGFLSGGELALVHGGAIALLVAVMYKSGAHLNPIVTFAMFLDGKIGLVVGLVYIIVQLLGAIGGVIFANEFLAKEIIANGAPFAEATEAAKLATPAIANYLSVRSVFALETLLSFVLMLTIFKMVVEHKVAPYAAAPFIGLAVALDVAIGGPFTGAAMNPARAFGPALVSGYWAHHWVYWAAPMTGAFIAWVFHKVTSIEEKP